MPGSCHLTMFIYYLGLWSRYLKSYPLHLENLGGKKLVTFGSRTWVPISLVWPNEGLGCPVYYAYQALCVQFCFGFNLLLSTAYFCVPLYRIFIDNSFRFCIKLFTYFGLNYCTWTCFTLAYLGTMALIWPSFCFIKFTNLCEWNYLQRV